MTKVNDMVALFLKLTPRRVWAERALLAPGRLRDVLSAACSRQEPAAELWASWPRWLKDNARIELMLRAREGELWDLATPYDRFRECADELELLKSDRTRRNAKPTKLCIEN